MLNRLASLAMSTSVFKALPGKFDIKRHLPSIVYVSGQSCQTISYEPVHEISNNVVCATSKASDQPAHTRSLIRAFAIRLSIL